LVLHVPPVTGRRVSGLVCLQGGGEFSSGCRAMDSRFLRRVAGGPQPVRVAVVALAAAPGGEYDTAAANGVAHYTRLGADAVVVPDARTDPDGAVAAVRQARLVVLPGGSPSRLLTALRDTGLGDLLVALVADGVAVSGASAGAMVLCDRTVLPDRRGPHGLEVAPAVGLVSGAVVVPHWSGGSSRGDWLRAISAGAPDGTVVLGLPEESGVVLQGERATAVGRWPSCWVAEERDLPPGTTRLLSASTGKE
jgi:cyanophycinase-like exopeptidase